VSTPRYSASLSKSPKPSFLSDSAKRTEGLVASKAVRAYLAAVDASLSLVNKKRAACLFWNIFSTAPLSKGTISALTKRTRIVARTKVLNILVVWLDKIYNNIEILRLNLNDLIN